MARGLIACVLPRRYSDRNQLQAIYSAYLQPVLSQRLRSHPVWGSVKNGHTLAGSMVSVYEQVRTAQAGGGGEGKMGQEPHDPVLRLERGGAKESTGGGSCLKPANPGLAKFFISISELGSISAALSGPAFVPLMKERGLTFPSQRLVTEPVSEPASWN